MAGVRKEFLCQGFVASLGLADPGGEDVPLHLLAPVDGDAVLGVLVLAGLQVAQHLLGQLRQEPPVDDVVLRRSMTDSDGGRRLMQGFGWCLRDGECAAAQGRLPGSLSE